MRLNSWFIWSLGTWLLRAQPLRSLIGIWMKWQTWLSSCSARLGSRCFGSPAISLLTKGHCFHKNKLLSHKKTTNIHFFGHVTGTWMVQPLTLIVTFWLMLVPRLKRDWTLPRNWVLKILVRSHNDVTLNMRPSSKCCSIDLNRAFLLSAVFWGGREGFHSILNTDVASELKHMANFFRMAVGRYMSIYQ